MCRYATKNYRKVFICTDCRIGWKGPRETVIPDTGTIHCLKCQKPGIDMGHDFHVPRRLRVNAWRKIDKMLEHGYNWQSCGCHGPGPRPRTYSESKQLKGTQ